MVPIKVKCCHLLNIKSLYMRVILNMMFFLYLYVEVDIKLALGIFLTFPSTLCSTGICLCAWMAVSVEVVLVIPLGMLLSPNYHHQRECGQVFLMAWMEEFFR